MIIIVIIFTIWYIKIVSVWKNANCKKRRDDKCQLYMYKEMCEYKNININIKIYEILIIKIINNKQ